MTQVGEGVSGSVTPTPPAHKHGHLHLKSRTVAAWKKKRTTVGVGEKVDLTVSGASGAVSWTITGNSTLNTATGLTVTLKAHDRAEKTVVTATDTCGCKKMLKFSVIEPSKVKMERAPGKKVWHTTSIPSVGIKTNIYLLPQTVSFENIKISEDDCVSVVTGYFVGTPLDGVHHAGHGAGVWVTVGQVVSGKGSKVNGQDTAQSGHCNFGIPYKKGAFDWPIPWKFRVGGGAEKVFTTVHQRFAITASGHMVVTKAGASGKAKLNAPSSTY